jgi:ABC-2 type transport system ATP-binding protein
LLNDPRLLIVDEPTAGLDPEERIRFRNLLSDLSGDRIVILSTHIVSDVEASATRIAVIRKGRLLIDAMPEELLQEVEGKVWEWIVSSGDLPSIKQQYAISGTVRHRDGVEVRIISASSPDGNAHLTPPRLEDAYLHLIADKGKCRTP